MAVLACLEASLGFITAKDCLILFIGAVLGCYASFVASQYFFWNAVKHDIFYRVELLTALLNLRSDEVMGKPYPLYRIIEAKAIELVYQRHKKAYEECHAIADEMERVFRRIRSSADDVQWTDVSSLKTNWLQRIAALRPNWWAFFTPRKNANSVLEFYLPKEAEYVASARASMVSHGVSVKDLDAPAATSD